MRFLRPQGRGVAGEGQQGGRWQRWLLPLSHLGGLLLLALFILVRIWDPPPVQTLRLQSFDLMQQAQPRAATQQPVTIVDIDDESLARLGQWPWPRTQLATLTERLFEAGAITVGFDIIFAEPDRTSPERLADSLPQLDAGLRERLLTLPSNDRRFAEAVASHRVVLVQAPVARKPSEVRDTRPVKTAIAEIGDDPRPFLFGYGGLVRNLPVLEQAATGLGGVTLTPETDGVVRRVPLLVNVDGALVPSLIIEMLRVATGQNAIAVKSNAAGVDSLVVANTAITTDRHGRKWVRYAPAGSTERVSAWRALEGEADGASLAGRLVLVGSSATALQDIKATPVAPAMAGVEVHAQLLETILAQASLTRPNYALGAELFIIAATGLLVMLLTPLVGAVATLTVGSLLAAVLLAGSWYAFSEHGLLLDVGYSLVAGFTVFSASVYGKYLREDAARKSVRRAFSQYLSAELVDQLAEHPEQLRLGGENREMTVMFSDVRGFTSIAERRSAQDLTALVNRVLTCMTGPILERRGTIDKYIGDCVMAFWNAPLSDPEHARHACLAALAMIEDVAAMNAAAREEADASGAETPPEIAIGVGLNSGECYVGNMGSAQRFNYSVLGDTVNLSSRLEGQCKTYGCPIVVGESTAAQVPELAFLELDRILVKGKHEPVRMFALLGDAAVAEDPTFRELLAAHRKMLDAHREGAWRDARRALEACRRLVGDWPVAKLYELYGARIDEAQAHEPVADTGTDGLRSR